MSLSSKISSDEAINQLDSMTEHYADLDNAFQLTAAVTEPQKNRRLCLKNIPVDLSTQAIKNILEKYGELRDLSIPANQEGFKHYQKTGYKTVFVEFSTVCGAETAMRDLNGRTNSILNIRVEFAFPRRQEEQPIIELPKSQYPVEDQPKFPPMRPPIFVNFDVPYDNVFEKITDFERKPISLSSAQVRRREFMLKMANESISSYDSETSNCVHNPELIKEVRSNMPKCCKCLRVAILRCEDTSMNYCSLKCSKELLVTQETLDKNEVAYGASAQVNDRVQITAIISENCFYIQQYGFNRGFIHTDIQKFAKIAPQLEMLPDINDLVLARFGDEFYRARVLQVSDDEPYAISVILIDSGNTGRVHLKDLSIMEPACQRIQCVVQKVFLKDVNIPAINYDIIDLLTELNSTKKEIRLKEIEGDEVVLEDVELGNINQLIVQLSEVKEATNADRGARMSDYHELFSIPPGTNQHLFVVNAQPIEAKPEYIACVPERDYKDFIQLYKAINVYARNRKLDESGLPRRDIIFLVLCNGQWHRAVKSKSNGDGYPVCLLIDLLSHQRISVNDIIPMPTVFAHPPPLVQMCKIDGYCEETAALVEENKLIFVGEITSDENDECVLLNLRA